MNAHTRIFEAKPAVRERVPLLIGLVGPSSSGKTKSALRIAEGIQSVVGGDVYGIDTESRRMAHYADVHKFQHVEFKAPFGSLDYLAAIKFCVDKGAKTVIVDSMSHEHDGPGGMIEFQEREVDRLGGDDWQKRERVKMLAWQKPKAARRALIGGLLQLNANFIFCFRAREKTKPMKINGKTEIVELGFMPIAGEEFLFEMTANCMLPPKSGGVPVWQSEHVGERGIMKLPSYLAHAFPKDKPLDEDTGRALAAWARGGAPATPSVSPPPPVLHTAAGPAGPASPSPDAGPAAETDSQRIARLDIELGNTAKLGMAKLQAAWTEISPADQRVLKGALTNRHKPTAVEADKQAAGETV